jgi:hypothetical protein
LHKAKLKTRQNINRNRNRTFTVRLSPAVLRLHFCVGFQLQK